MAPHSTSQTSNLDLKAPPQTQAIFSFSHPDLSIPATDRAIYAPPPSLSVHHLTLPLHDIRSDPSLSLGLSSIDAHGFTLLKHTTSLTKEQMLEGRNVEDVYAPEMVKLALEVTGASRAVVHNVAFRRKEAVKKGEEGKGRMRADEGERALVGEERKARERKDSGSFVQVNGRTMADAQQPARHAHIDLTLQGLRDTLRLARPDITAIAKPVIDAESARERGEDVVVPRFASYSMWRPLKTVTHDSLALLSSRSLSPADIIATTNRIPSSYPFPLPHPNSLSDGSYVVEAYTALPPQHPEQQTWYWVPQQRTDEVLMLKFADSWGGEAGEVSDEGEARRVSAGCVHCSPVLLGENDEEVKGEGVRESVETRVYCFWD